MINWEKKYKEEKARGGKKGGLTTLERHGREYFVELQKKSAKKRRKNKRISLSPVLEK